MTAVEPLFLLTGLAGLRLGSLARHLWGPLCTDNTVDNATYHIFAESLPDTDTLTGIFTVEAQMWGGEDSGTSFL